MAGQTQHTVPYQRWRPPLRLTQTSGTDRRQTLKKQQGGASSVQNMNIETDNITLWLKRQTWCDAVKRVRQQVVEPLPLVAGRTTAVDVIQRGVGMVHPLHQPFKLAIANQVVATKISTYMGGWDMDDNLHDKIPTSNALCLFDLCLVSDHFSIIYLLSWHFAIASSVYLQKPSILQHNLTIISFCHYLQLEKNDRRRLFCTFVFVLLLLFHLYFTRNRFLGKGTPKSKRQPHIQ